MTREPSKHKPTSDHLEAFIIGYLERQGESRYADFQTAALNKQFTPGQISSKTRTLKASGVIFQRSSGVYALSSTLCYKQELLDDIAGLLDKYNFKPKDLTHEPDINAFYLTYTALQELQELHQSRSGGDNHG